MGKHISFLSVARNVCMYVCRVLQGARDVLRSFRCSSGDGTDAYIPSVQRRYGHWGERPDEIEALTPLHTVHTYSQSQHVSTQVPRIIHTLTHIPPPERLPITLLTDHTSIRGLEFRIRVHTEFKGRLPGGRFFLRCGEETCEICTYVHIMCVHVCAGGSGVYICTCMQVGCPMSVWGLAIRDGGLAWLCVAGFFFMYTV